MTFRRRTRRPVRTRCDSCPRRSGGAPIELAGQRLRPHVRGGGIVGGADDDDRRRAAARGSARPCPRRARAKRARQTEPDVDGAECGATRRAPRREMLHAATVVGAGRVDDSRSRRTRPSRSSTSRPCGDPCTRRKREHLGRRCLARPGRARPRGRRSRRPAYSALATPMSNSPGPSVRCSPSTVAGIGSSAIVRGEIVERGGGVAAVRERARASSRQWSKNASRSSSKLLAWSIVVSAYERAGSTAPSSTMARTRVGNRSAYSGAEQRAVREADVADLRLAHRGADRVQVARRRRRRHVREHRCRCCAGTRRRTSVHAATFSATRGGSVRDRDRPRRTGRGRRGSGPASSAPTPRGSHDTRSNELRISAGNRSAASRRKSTPDPPGPPGIREEHADRLAPGGQAGQRERDVRPVGMREVERDRQRPALDLAARRPLDRAGALVSQDDRPAAPACTRRASPTTTRRRAPRRAVGCPSRHPRLGGCSGSARTPTRRSSPRCCTKPSTGATTAPRSGRRSTRCSRSPRTRATSPTGDGPATSRCARSIVATSRSAPRGSAASPRPSPATATSPTTFPSSSIAVYPEFRRQRVGTLLLGSVIARAERDRRAGDQPEREHRQSGQAHVRALRVRGRRRTRRRADDAPRRRLSDSNRRTNGAWIGVAGVREGRAPVGDDGARTGRMQRCATSLRNRASGESAPPPIFEAPHSNGAVHQAKPGRAHAPWEFIVLTLFVAILCIGIIFGWTLVGSHSPERLDDDRGCRASRPRATGRRPVEGAAQPRSAPTAPTASRGSAPKTSCCATMVGAVRDGAPDVVDAGRRGAGLERRLGSHDRRPRRATPTTSTKSATTNRAKVRFIYPAVNAITPITRTHGRLRAREHTRASTRASPPRSSSRSSKDRANYQKVTS